MTNKCRLRVCRAGDTAVTFSHLSFHAGFFRRLCGAVAELDARSLQGWAMFGVGLIGSTLAVPTDPWCPGGIQGRCPCPSPSMSYRMKSFSSVSVQTGSGHGFTAYESTSTSCTPHRYAHGNASGSCLPQAQVVWKPDEWESPIRPTKPPDVTMRHIERACDGITVHVAKSHWVPNVRTLYNTKYGPKSWTLISSATNGTASQNVAIDSANSSAQQARRRRRATCIERLLSFKPKVCSLRNVLVWGHARRMMSANGSMYYIPPEATGWSKHELNARDEQTAHDKACPANCRARPHQVVACGGHAVIGRNLMGVAYVRALRAIKPRSVHAPSVRSHTALTTYLQFHTLYETFGSIAYILDLLAPPASYVLGGTSRGPNARGHRGNHSGSGGGGGSNEHTARVSRHSHSRQLGERRFEAAEMTESPASHETPTTPSPPAVRLLENMCIPADGAQIWMNMKSRTCGGEGVFGAGPPGFLSSMLNFLGIATHQLQHYPYVRQWDGPAIHLDRATFDCSPANYRNYWHALKLRHALHARLLLGTQPPALDTILLMDRNQCERSAAATADARRSAATGGKVGGSSGLAGNTSVKASGAAAIGRGPSHSHDKCKKGRGVRLHHLIRRALEERFTGVNGLRVVDFMGTEPWEEQARLFHRAAVVVGPHGAQVANIIFCQRRASVVEFVASRRSNSALYAGYASSVFGLDYWAVVSNSTNGSYDDITPDDTVQTVEMALERQEQRKQEQRHSRGGGGSGASTTGDATSLRYTTRRSWSLGAWHVLQGDEESNLVSGYGNYQKGWPAGW